MSIATSLSTRCRTFANERCQENDAAGVPGRRPRGRKPGTAALAAHPTRSTRVRLPTSLHRVLDFRPSSVKKEDEAEERAAGATTQRPVARDRAGARGHCGATPLWRGACTAPVSRARAALLCVGSRHAQHVCSGVTSPLCHLFQSLMRKTPRSGAPMKGVARGDGS